SLQPLQRRVDLADVERPHLAGTGFELLAQLEPVLGPLAEQGEQGMPDTHRCSFFGIMRRTILSIITGRGGARSTFLGELCPRICAAVPVTWASAEPRSRPPGGCDRRPTRDLPPTGTSGPGRRR